jgi:hypothetical protein
MLKFRTRLLAGLVSVAALTSQAHAQWLNSWDPCNACAQPVAVCNPCMQAIPKTVYRDVPVTEYRAVKRTEKRPVLRTVMEDRPATRYRQVTETKTCDVQGVAYQTVTECRQQCVNRSRWQTVMQPVAKMSPCQYDSRPGLLGEFNRLGYATRMAFTPSYIARREFVPDMQMVNVPVQRTVAVPTVRQVSYNVAKLVPEEYTEQVAVLKTEYVDTEVTAYEPFTTTRRMAVGTTYQYAYVDGFGGSTATAAQPTPADGARTAEGDSNNTPVKGLSYPKSESTPKAQPQPTPAEPQGKVAAAPAKSPAVIHTVGWRPARSAEPVAAERK